MSAEFRVDDQTAEECRYCGKGTTSLALNEPTFEGGPIAYGCTCCLLLVPAWWGVGERADAALAYATENNSAYTARLLEDQRDAIYSFLSFADWDWVGYVHTAGLLFLMVDTPSITRGAEVEHMEIARRRCEEHLNRRVTVLHVAHSKRGGPVLAAIMTPEPGRPE